jgi:hypothetical protein
MFARTIQLDREEVPMTNNLDSEDPKETDVQSVPFVSKALAIVRPMWGRILFFLIVAIGFLSIHFKHTVEGSSWIFAVGNAAMVTVGAGLAALSTAVIMRDANRKDR